MSLRGANTRKGYATSLRLVPRQRLCRRRGNLTVIYFEFDKIGVKLQGIPKNCARAAVGKVPLYYYLIKRALFI